ncbi:hypothetical protein EDB84DRAFT_1565276 [Lactarius hengduanensis]|nr:hypothetical protein EDB84DRAFT_1565276 [Lactarius hengduanensis]
MASPSRNETRSYSPSKLSELPALILTPSSGPLNMSGSYAPALPGPIIASGNGQPRRRDGHAYWDDTAGPAAMISITSSSPPAAGEEPTVPAFDYTQVGPATMQAIEAALAPLAEHEEQGSQQLWDNVPSFPADLPPQPEVIEVRGRTTSHTPRVRSQALSNASVWSHATVESASMDGSPVRFLPSVHSQDIITAQFTTALQLAKAGFLGPSYDFEALETGYINQGSAPEEDANLLLELAETDETLKEELARDVTEQAIGWGGYHLGAPLQMSKDNNFPTGPKTVHAATALTITLIDAGASATRGDLFANGLTPSSWTRLCLGLLAAMIRGALRSPPILTRGSKSLNGSPDAFPKHTGLDVPLTEGGAIMLMTQQLGGLFTSYKNHPDKTYPDSYFAKLIATLDNTFDKYEGKTTAPVNQPPPPAQPAGPTREEIREWHYADQLELLRVNPAEMETITAAVKEHMFKMLNNEAMNNLDEWKELYKYEFVEAMHTAFEAQYPGIHPGKGKARANPPPLTLSQVVRDATPQIQREVEVQVDARIKNIHNEIRDSLGAHDPFWTGGPLRESIAAKVIAATTAQVQTDLETRTAALKQEADDELAALKLQCQHDYASKLEDFKTGVWDMCKDWKTKYNNARSLHTLCDLAHKRGFALTPLDPLALQRETNAFKTYALDPLTVDGFELSSSPPSRAHSPVTDKPLTPPNPTAPLFLTDPNVTPTPGGRPWSSSSPARAKALPLPPTPMEEDFDYALEVWGDATAAKNGGIYDSDHAPTPVAQPTPLPAHNPSVPPQVAALAAQAEQPTTAPNPVTVAPRPAGLVGLPPAPPMAALVDGLAQLIAALNMTISRLDAKLDAGLDVQNKRIDALLQSRDPRPKPVKAQSAKAKEAVAAPPAPNTAKAPGPSATDEILSHVARIDDPVDEPIAELFTEGVSTLPTPNATVIREAFQPPADKLVRLETDARGKPTPTATMPVSWAGVVTQKAAHQQTTAAAHAKSTNQAMGRTNGGKSRPETAARRTNSANTDVTVIRGHGVEDPLFKLQLFKRAPSTFVAEIRQEIERMSQGKLIILSARWSQKANAHNFVYTFQGDVPFAQIFPFRHLLVKPLLAGYIVPNDGWTHAQLRDVATRAPDGTIYTNDDLMKELCRNTPFKDAIFCLVPHWQGSAFTVAHSEKTTVSMAFVDEHGTVSSAAVAAGTFMFNARARLIITGDSPSIVMCGRCHRIGHATNTPACPLPANGATTRRRAYARVSLNVSTATGNTLARTRPLSTPPPPSAKGKGKQVAPPPPEDLVPTQREPTSGSAGAITTEEPFTTVKRSHNRNGSAKRAAKLTSRVPARPLTTNSAPPTKASAAAHFAPPIPDWKEAPTIGEPHVATAAKTLAAIGIITAKSTDSSRNDDIAIVCGDWKKAIIDDDPLSTLMTCIPFRFAVRYGLPLTAHATVTALTRSKSMAAARDALYEFNDKWGDVSPFFFTLSKLDSDHSQSFILPGRFWNPLWTRRLNKSGSNAPPPSSPPASPFKNSPTPTPSSPSLPTRSRTWRAHTPTPTSSTSARELWTIVKDSQLSLNATASMPHA